MSPLTAAIMMALSRKPNPTKGMALWNKTVKQEKVTKRNNIKENLTLLFSKT